MKKVLFTIVFLVTSIYDSNAQWGSQVSGTNEFLTFLSFPDADNGFAISESGVIHKTVDGGANWNTLSTENGMKITFIDTQKGFVYGTNEVLQTIDGGNNWAVVLNLDISLWVSGIYFIDQNTGFAAAADYTDSLAIFKTTDGGASWIHLSSDYSNVAWVSALYFINQNIGFICNVDGQILKTNDGGLNWNTAHFATSMVNDIVFADANTGYAVSENIFLKSLDAGSTWSETTLSFSGIFLGIDVTSNGTIHITGGNGLNTATLIKSTNGGTNWTQTGTGTQQFNDVEFVNDSIGYTCGTNGTILKYESSAGVGMIEIKENSLKVHIVQDNLIITRNTNLEENLELYSTDGKLVLVATLNLKSETLSVSQMAKGIYIVKIGNETIKIKI